MERATGVRTKGLNSTGNTAHLNLTVTMAGTVTAEAAAHDKNSTMSRKRRYERQQAAKIGYAGRENA